MSKYDGLNLPQLLQLMHGIVVPEPVAWLPQTPGWWILLAWLFALLCMAGWFVLQRRHRNRYRREALAELKTIMADESLGPDESAQQISALLKRTALAVYPRRQVAPLYGEPWAQFLLQSARGDKRVAKASKALAAAAYHPESDGTELVVAARHWIRRHRA